MRFEGALTKSLYTFPRPLCFLLDDFCSIKYEFPIVRNQSFCSRPQNAPLLLTYTVHKLCARHHRNVGLRCSQRGGELGEASQLSPEQLESLQCSWLAPVSLLIMSAAKTGPLAFLPLLPRPVVTLATGKQGHTGAGTASVSQGKQLLGCCKLLCPDLIIKNRFATQLKGG